MGKDEKWLVQQARRQGQPLPERVTNAPELWHGLELYLQAFMELTSCRGLGYGAIGPVPWLAIQKYAEVYGIEGEQREDLFYHVQHLDKAYMDWQRDKAKKEEEARQREAPKGKAPRPRRRK